MHIFTKGFPFIFKPFTVISFSLILLNANLSKSIAQDLDKPLDGKSRGKRSFLHLDEAGGFFGYSLSGGLIPEGKYRPFLFLSYLSIKVGKKPSYQTKSSFYLYLEPQINPVLFRGILGTLEGGLGLGFKYRVNLTKSFKLYAAVTTGPHYTSVDSEAQAKGYIFSDNFFGGLEINLSPKTSIHLQYRFRHISNAGIEEPNRGINNHLLLLGFSKRILPSL